MGEEKKVLVTNIQRFSISDGPGIRTTVFMKGCPLRCTWCHNPECINPYEEFYYIESKCTRCGQCAMICPEAITPPGPNGESPLRDREKCNRYMKCFDAVDACPNRALERVGQPLSVAEIMKEVNRDESFYRNSGGGMTISGGEPLFHPEFTLELLKEAKKFGIHTVLDTCGYTKWSNFEKVLDYVDLVLADIKHMDSRKHEEFTGAPNELILTNIRKIAERGTKMRIRLPIIPDFNNSEEYIEEVAEFVKELGEGVVGVDLLPFHNWAERKYNQLDKSYEFKEFDSMTKEDVEDFKEIFESNGFKTTIGG
jgi:pyruvate formate lyase activating enzyme